MQQSSSTVPTMARALLWVLVIMLLTGCAESTADEEDREDGAVDDEAAGLVDHGPILRDGRPWIEPGEAPQGPAPAHQLSPEALLAHARGLLEHSPPRRFPLLDLCQWENPQQEAWHVFLRNYCFPAADFKEALAARFPNHTLRERFPFEQIRIRDTTITKKDAQRAEGQLLDGGSARTLYLVNKYDRWWISGYTFEYAGEAHLQKHAGGSYQELELKGVALARSGPAIAELAQRVRMGEFRSEVEAARAFAEIVGMQPPQGR